MSWHTRSMSAQKGNSHEVDVILSTIDLFSSVVALSSWMEKHFPEDGWEAQRYWIVEQRQRRVDSFITLGFLLLDDAIKFKLTFDEDTAWDE